MKFIQQARSFASRIFKRLVSQKVMVRVKTQGHQIYYETIGELLQTCMSVEKYDDKYMQVPALLIKTDGKIILVPLQKHLRWTEVDFYSG